MSAAKAAFFKRPRLPVVRIILGVAVVGVTTKLALGHFALQHYKGLLDNKQAQVQKSLSSIVAQAKPTLDWERVMAGVAAEEARIAAEEVNKGAR